MATWATSGSNVELSLPRAWIGNPEVFKIFFLDDNQSTGGTLEDAYPRTALQTGGGGTWLAYRLVSANPNLDSVGDGIPNWWRQLYFGGNGTTTNVPGSCATCDPDGDGMSNLQEYLAGTNPTNAASRFTITSLAFTNGNVRVRWSAVGGKHYVLQTNSALGMAFSDASPVIAVPGTGETVTNYLDPGAATNSKTHYYRIRLAP